MSPHEPSDRLTEEYNTEAAAYRDYWSPVIHPMGVACLQALPALAPSYIFDIGAGTGALMHVLAERYPQAFIVGMDRSEGMLVHAAGADVFVGDAMAVSAAAGAFDLAVLNFMLFHVPKPEQGLREVVRVLRSGGMVSVTTWGNDMVGDPIDLWNQALDRFGAQPASTVERLAQHELVDTIPKMTALLTAAGFTDVGVKVHTFDANIPLEHFITLRTSVGSNAIRFASLDDATQKELIAHARAQFASLREDDFTFRFEVIHSTGVRP